MRLPFLLEKASLCIFRRGPTWLRSAWPSFDVVTGTPITGPTRNATAKTISSSQRYTQICETSTKDFIFMKLCNNHNTKKSRKEKDGYFILRNWACAPGRTWRGAPRGRCWKTWPGWIMSAKTEVTAIPDYGKIMILAAEIQHLIRWLHIIWVYVLIMNPQKNV